MNKKAHDVKKEFNKLEKIKANLLKKTEADRHKLERELDKMESEINRSKDLAPESKMRLNAESSAVKSEINNTYFDLKTRIAETYIPA
jgi:hypothetical protein